MQGSGHAEADVAGSDEDAASSSDGQGSSYFSGEVLARVSSSPSPDLPQDRASFLTADLMNVYMPERCTILMPGICCVAAACCSMHLANQNFCYDQDVLNCLEISPWPCDIRNVKIPIF